MGKNCTGVIFAREKKKKQKKKVTEVNEEKNKRQFKKTEKIPIEVKGQG